MFAYAKRIDRAVKKKTKLMMTGYNSITVAVSVRICFVKLIRSCESRSIRIAAE